MPDATLATPDVTTFCRPDELGLEVVGQHLQPDRVVLACRVADDAVEEADRRCRRCSCEGRPRDTVTRRLAHEPVGWRPATLLLSIRRYRCAGCGHVWREDTSRADLLTDRQHQRLTALFGVEDHVAVEAAWGVYQRMIADYRHPDRAAGRAEMSSIITNLSEGVPAALTELEHLRGSALGFRNLAHYVARSLLETGAFRPRLHPQS